MNSNQVVTRLFLTVLATCFSIVARPRPLLGQIGQEWGQAENGLQMSIYPAQEDRESLTAFRYRVEIRNVGKKDLLLVLGGMLANGRKQYPDAVRVLLTNAQGKTLDCGIPGPAAVSGWVGPFIVPLPVGASFLLPVDLKEWTSNWTWCSTPRVQDPLLTFTPGKYALRARYSASTVRGDYWPPNPGSPSPVQTPDEILWGGIILMPKWLGSVTSNQIEFQVPAHPSLK